MLGHDSERRQAFELVVRHYSEQLYWTIRRFVLTHEDADDVLQNTFVKAWQNLPAFERRSSLSTWLHRIAVNEAIDHLRRNKNRIAAEQVEPLALRLLADDYFDGNVVRLRSLFKGNPHGKDIFGCERAECHLFRRRSRPRASAPPR